MKNQDFIKYLDQLDNNIINSRNYLNDDSISKMFHMEYKEITNKLNSMHIELEKNFNIQEYEKMIQQLKQNHQYVLKIYENFLNDFQYKNLLSIFKTILQKEILEKEIFQNPLQLKKTKI